MPRAYGLPYNFKLKMVVHRMDKSCKSEKVVRVVIELFLVVAEKEHLRYLPNYYAYSELTVFTFGF